MAEMMKGKLFVASERGKGSAFTLYVPQKYSSDATIQPDVIEALEKFEYVKPKKIEQTEETGQPEKPEQAEKTEPPEKPGQAEQAENTEPAEKSEQTEKAEPAEKPEQTEKPEPAKKT
jgi:hypothetical protein